MPDAHQPETRQPQPPESAARTDSPSESMAAPILPSSPRFTLRETFFGSDGLRAGWALLLYFALLGALMAGGMFLVNPPRHKPAVTQTNSAAQPNAAAQSAPQPSKPSAAVLMPPKAVLLGEGIALLAVLIAAWLMAKIERRPTSAYGLGGRRRLPNFLAGLGWGVALLSLLVFTLRACGLLVFDAPQIFGASALRYGAVWFAGFLLVGLFEETFFRGYLQFTLARGINGTFDWLRSFAARAANLRTATQSAPGFWTAALLLSFGFGFTHRTNPGESPIGLRRRRAHRCRLLPQPVAHRLALVGHRLPRGVGLGAVLPLRRRRQRPCDSGPSLRHASRGPRPPFRRPHWAGGQSLHPAHRSVDRRCHPAHPALRPSQRSACIRERALRRWIRLVAKP